MNSKVTSEGSRPMAGVDGIGQTLPDVVTLPDIANMGAGSRDSTTTFDMRRALQLHDIFRVL